MIKTEFFSGATCLLEVLAYIGPNRCSGQLDQYYEGSGWYKGCDLRIKYLDKTEDGE